MLLKVKKSSKPDMTNKIESQGGPFSCMTVALEWDLSTLFACVMYYRNTSLSLFFEATLMWFGC
jgi:hypothetical protein